MEVIVVYASRVKSLTGSSGTEKVTVNQLSGSKCGYDVCVCKDWSQWPVETL